MKQEIFKVDVLGKDIKVIMNLICSSKCFGEVEIVILVEEY